MNQIFWCQDMKRTKIRPRHNYIIWLNNDNGCSCDGSWTWYIHKHLIVVIYHQTFPYILHLIFDMGKVIHDTSKEYINTGEQVNDITHSLKCLIYANFSYHPSKAHPQVGNIGAK